MVLMSPENESLFGSDIKALMCIERNLYSQRKLLLDFFYSKGISDYSQFEALILMYFPDYCKTDLKNFWLGFQWMQYVLEVVGFVFETANNRNYEYITGVKFICCDKCSGHGKLKQE